MTRPNGGDLATDPVTRDVIADSATHAHADAEVERSDKQTALAHRRSRRTAHRWRTNGRGSPQDQYDLYLWHSPDPYRLEAHVRSIRKQRTAVEQMSRSETIARYREVVRREKEVEGRDSALDLTPGANWLDRARESERDAALDIEKAALERRMAALRVTDAEVWG